MGNIKCNLFLFYWLPAAAYAAFLFYLSSQSDVQLPKFPFIDKIGHFILYAGFSFFFARAVLPFQHQRVLKKTLLWGVVGAILYGITDEFHQSFVPHRSVEGADVIADAIGGLMGGFLLVVEGYIKNYVQKRFPNRFKKTLS